MENAIQKMIDAKAVLAPMAGITDISFRMMARKFGCAFAFTEMIDVNGIFYENRKTCKLMDTVPGDAPLGVQLVGEDVERMVLAAKLCEEKAFQVLDINAGCPARKVVKGGKGVALMRDTQKLAGIVRAVVKAVSIPVTVKIRSGWDDNNLNYMETAKAVQSEGASAICVHTRTKEQMYKGKPDHKIAAELCQALKIPVFASGNIFTARDAEDVLKETGCSGVFVARGALGRPWIFEDINKCFSGENSPNSFQFYDIKDVIKEHFSLSLEYYGDFLTLKRMHKHLTWYLKGSKNLNDIMKEYRRVKDLESFCGFLERVEVDGRDKACLVL